MSNISNSESEYPKKRKEQESDLNFNPYKVDGNMPQCPISQERQFFVIQSINKAFVKMLQAEQEENQVLKDKTIKKQNDYKDFYDSIKQEVSLPDLELQSFDDFLKQYEQSTLLNAKKDLPIVTLQKLNNLISDNTFDKESLLVNSQNQANQEVFEQMMDNNSINYHYGDNLELDVYALISPYLEIANDHLNKHPNYGQEYTDKIITDYKSIELTRKIQNSMNAEDLVTQLYQKLQAKLKLDNNDNNQNQNLEYCSKIVKVVSQILFTRDNNLIIKINQIISQPLNIEAIASKLEQLVDAPGNSNLQYQLQLAKIAQERSAIIEYDLKFEDENFYNSQKSESSQAPNPQSIITEIATKTKLLNLKLPEDQKLDVQKINEFINNLGNLINEQNRL
jgi:hypothetical protein